MRRGGPAWRAATWLGAIVAVGLAIGLALAFCELPPRPAVATATPLPATPPGRPTLESSTTPTPAPAGPSMTPDARVGSTPTVLPVPSADPAAQAVGAWTPPQATKSSGCVYQRAADHALLPDPGCTTGATDPSLPASTLCGPGFRSVDHRHVSDSLKSRIYGAYGIARAGGPSYEIDHLVPIEVGGSNDPENLWPQPADPTPGYREKDRVENWLRGQVCAGAIALADAQRTIATEWTAYLGQAAGAAPKIHLGDDEAD